MKRALLLVSLLLAVPAFGQSADEAESKETTTLRERIRRAIRLPETAQESREAGVPDERVRELLRTFRERRIPAGDAVEILEVENVALRAGADPGNFGAAVGELKASGLRGRELAEAIHAEQVARGMKKHERGPDGEVSGEAHGKAKGKAREGGER